MSRICPRCGEEKYSWVVGTDICFDCYDKEKKQNIYDKACITEQAKDFKDWSSKDMTTAFFEAFGRYINEPNEKDIRIANRIFVWACHADQALASAISYTLKWAKMDWHTELSKWR